MLTSRPVPWLLWPFYVVAQLVTGILKLTGRLLAAIIGFVLLVVGGVLCLTIIGAILGIPLMIFGLMLMVRAIF
ncbi:MAG: hypothetical protein U0175_33995 [Caldilineaceae bacterium]